MTYKKHFQYLSISDSKSSVSFFAIAAVVISNLLLFPTAHFSHHAREKFSIFLVTFALSIIIWFDGDDVALCVCAAAAHRYRHHHVHFFEIQCVHGSKHFPISLLAYIFSSSIFSRIVMCFFFCAVRPLFKKPTDGFDLQISNALCKNTISTVDANACLPIWSVWNHPIFVCTYYISVPLSTTASDSTECISLSISANKLKSSFNYFGNFFFLVFLSVFHLRHSETIWIEWMNKNEINNIAHAIEMKEINSRNLQSERYCMGQYTQQQP